MITGIHEFEGRLAGGRSALELKADCARAALEDAGLTWRDVDGLYDVGEAAATLPGPSMAEYLGFEPRVVESTHIGGASYELLLARAAQDVRAGRVTVALITYGSTTRTGSGPGGLNTRKPGPTTPIADEQERAGLSLVGNYALAAARHMHQFGTPPEALAEIAVVTRSHALRNPAAVAGLETLGIDPRPLSVTDVLESRAIADPLRLLDCCLITDGAGAVVVTSEEIARDSPHPLVAVLGCGEAVRYLDRGTDITVTAAAESGPRAFAEAGLTPADVDVAMLYDSFTITVLLLLEDLGFCAKGEGGNYVRNGRLRFDSNDGPALNTDGGGLSSNHPGMRGIFLLIEATRQLRGQSTAQVPDARVAVCHGNGGWMVTRHAGATVVLGRL
ncbi:thiolase C-terminal domain-containing protein [Ornithinimicrobium faecis]|uniref:thiolase C-terminal domain-containing protein n=1 Tax=Ornithinimicrobium faecis TaxID=2934158 RepID=UPI00211819C0|nr:thiolase domain-containing protein [Ornithinimicrobium sp. HY1745]